MDTVRGRHSLLIDWIRSENGIANSLQAAPWMTQWSHVVLGEVRKAKPLDKRGLEDCFNVETMGKRNHKLTEGKVYHPFISIYGNIGDGLFFWVYHGISFYIFYETFSSWGSQCELYRAEKPQRLSTSQASANMRPDIM